MDTVVLKFGGSSVADNKRLNIVASKIIEFKKQAKKIIVVVSAQGKTTNRLINEALELSKIPDEREMDMLLSVGEQVSASKLSILLNKKGYNSISLTGWQAGIKTSDIHQNARIEEIHVDRLKKELEKGKIVIVCGFQGIDNIGNITTLGRGGSDTTAVSLAYALDADKCYIFSDVDGIYSADPKLVENAKKLESISFNEMQEISDAGSEVLHNRCIKIGNEYNLNIVAGPTFTDSEGTKIVKKIEDSCIKSIVKNTDMTQYKITKQGMFDRKDTYNIYNEILKNNIPVEHYKSGKEIEFYIMKNNRNKLEKLLKIKFNDYKFTDTKKVKLTFVGYGITEENKYMLEILKLLNNNKIEINNIESSQSKIEFIVNDIEDDVLKELHKKLIK